MNRLNPENVCNLGQSGVGGSNLTVAMIALADVGRATRFLNVLFGAWVVAAPWLLTGATTGAKINDAIAGVLVILLSFRHGSLPSATGVMKSLFDETEYETRCAHLHGGMTCQNKRD